MLRSDYSLRQYNTFKVDVKAKFFFEFKTSEDLKNYFLNRDVTGESFITLGGGSNILFRGDYGGTVLHSVNNDCLVEKELGDCSYVRAYAGMEWDGFVSFCDVRKLVGLAPLSLIPGSVGAAPVQNIGAYGTEVSQYVEEVECYDIKTKSVITFNNSECEFTYRDSAFRRRKELVVISVLFRLYKGERPHFECINKQSFDLFSRLKSVVRFLYLSYKSVKFGPSTKWRLKMSFDHLRELLQLPVVPSSIKRKLVVFIRTRNMPNPKLVANVGCFFKSPVISKNDVEQLGLNSQVKLYSYGSENYKVSAGDLLKVCGLQGYSEGGVGMDEKRPLILIKYDDVSGKAIYNFSLSIVEKVFSETGILIEPEVVIV